MEVILNRAVKTIDQDMSVTQLLEELNMKKNVAVFIDNVQILQKEYDTTLLVEQNNIRIFRPLSGG